MKKFTLMSPIKMQLICNIQGMQRAIDKNLHNSYQELQAMTEEELREKQDEILPQYNQAVERAVNRKPVTWTDPAGGTHIETGDDFDPASKYE